MIRGSFYVYTTPMKESSFNILLMGIRLLEESIRDDLNYDFSSKIFEKKSNTAEKINCIIFAQSENWQLVKTISDLGIDDYIVFSNIDEVYKEPTRLKGVNKIIISDLVDNIDPSTLIKVLNFTNRDADILLVREKNKCVLSNVHDINFISYGAKDRNFENRLHRFLKS